MGFSRIPSIVIGSSHLVLLGLCLHKKIWELIELAEPFLLRDNIVILTSYLAQILAASLLLLGVTTKRLKYTIPWILLCTILFSFGTLFAVFNVGFEESSQTLINFIVVGAIWTAWYNILRYNLDNNECISNISNYMKRYKKIPPDTMRE